MDPFTSRVSLCLLHSSLGNFLLKRLTTTSYLYTACPLSSCVAHASYKTASFCGTPLQISSFCHAPKSSKLWPHQQKELPIHAHASSEQFQQHQTWIPVVVYQKEPRAYYVATLPPGTDHCVLAQASQPRAKRVASTVPFCLDERASTHGPILRRTWQQDSNSYYMYDFSVCLGKLGICATILLLKLLHH